MKICPKCGDQFEADQNFCPKDGTKLVDEILETSKGSATNAGKIMAGGDIDITSNDAKLTQDNPSEEVFSMVSGGKILAGGDVNISKTVHQTVTNIRQDDAKKVMTCVVSGRQDVVTEGGVCGSCGQWAHKQHFNSQKGECKKCQKSSLEQKVNTYKETFLQYINNDNIIDSQERLILRELAENLGLDSEEILEIETTIRLGLESSFLKNRSPEDKLLIKRAKKDLYEKHNFEDAYHEFNELLESLPDDEEVFEHYMWAAISCRPRYALETLQKSSLFAIDSAEKSFYLVNIYEALNEEIKAKESLKKGLHLFPDDARLQFKQLERLIDLYFEDEQEEEELEDLKNSYQSLSGLLGKEADLYSQFIKSYFEIALDKKFLNVSGLEKISNNLHFTIKSNAGEVEGKYKFAKQKRINEEKRLKELEKLEEEKQLRITEEKKRAEEERERQQLERLRLEAERQFRIAEEKRLAEEEEKRAKEQEYQEKLIAEAALLEREMEQKSIAKAKRIALCKKLLVLLVVVVGPVFTISVVQQNVGILTFVQLAFSWVIWTFLKNKISKTYILLALVVTLYGLFDLFKNLDRKYSNYLDYQRVEKAEKIASELEMDFAQRIVGGKATAGKLEPTASVSVSSGNKVKPENELKSTEAPIGNSSTTTTSFKDTVVKIKKITRLVSGKLKELEIRGEVDSNGNFYEGTITYDRVTIFTGKIVGDYPVDGEVKFPNGDTFKGRLKNEKFESGTYFFANGNKYVGQFKDGREHDTNALFIEANGNRFSGGYLNDEKHGSGCMDYADGSQYVGDWVNNVQNGSGKLFLGDGSRYEGTVIDGFQGGKGYFYSDGKKQGVIWKDKQLWKKGFLGGLKAVPAKYPPWLDGK